MPIKSRSLGDVRGFANPGRWHTYRLQPPDMSNPLAIQAWVSDLKQWLLLNTGWNGANPDERVWLTGYGLRSGQSETAAKGTGHATILPSRHPNSVISGALDAQITYGLGIFTTLQSVDVNIRENT